MVNPSKFLFSVVCVLSPFLALKAQDCTLLPENRKVEKLLSKIEDNKDDIENEALYLELLEESDNDLSIQMLFNQYRIDGILREDVSFRSKIGQTFQQTINLDKFCDLNESQNLFLMQVLNAQERYEDFLKLFAKTRFESDSLINLERNLKKDAKIWIDILSATPVKREILPVVSSPASEYLPYLSTDGRFIYYTRKVTEKARGSVVSTEKELFVRTAFSADKKPIDDYVMPKPFNYGEGNYGGFSTTLTGDELFLTICKAQENGYRNCDIYSNYEMVDSLGKRTYSPLIPLPKTINNDTTWESQPAISADGKTLYFAHYPGEIGGIDIYYSQRDSEGNWQQSKPINGSVNTEFNEKAPFIHADGKHLYFSSDQKFSIGAYDLFFSEIVEDKFTNVKNLSKALNTSGDDHGIQIDADGKTAYISSNVNSRDATFDIYKITLPEAYQSEYRKVISGYIDYIPENGINVDLLNEKGENIANLKPKNNNHRFATLINEEQANSELLLRTTSNGEKEYFNASRIENDGKISDVKLNTSSLKNKGDAFTLDNVLFGVDDAVVSQKSKTILKAFANYMKEKSYSKLLIIGHTDNQGDAAYNLKLSEKRAEAVAKLLNEYGISSVKIESIGKGDTIPIVENNSESNRYKNRRTEVEIIK